MFLNYINYFRGFAILIVVLGHFVYANSNSEIIKLILTIFKGGTGPFVFISGFLFHHIFYRRGFNYKKFMVNKVKNVLLPYTIIIIPALTYCVLNYGINSNLYKNHKLLYVLIYYYSGSALFPTWYIPFAMFLFLASPIFIKFIRFSEKQQRVIIGLSLIISMIVQRPVHNMLLNIFQAFLYFFPFYSLGIYVSLYREEVLKKLEKTTKILLVLWIGIILLQFKFNLLDSKHKGLFELNGIDLMVVQKFIMCLLLLVLFVKLDRVKNLKFLKKILEQFANYSFGIFFIHGYLLLIRYKFNFNTLEEIISGVLAMYISIFIIWILRKIVGKNSRMIVGS